MLSSCKSNVPDFQLQELDPKIVIHVRLINGDESVDIDEDFTDSRAYRMRLVDLAFYVSDLHLIKNSGQTVTLDDVVLFDFTEKNTKGEWKPFTRSISYVVPAGAYTGLGFGLGLPPELNASDPTTFANDDPLRGSEMYWDWATAYRFIRFGAFMYERNGVTYDFDMQIHTGLDTMFIGGLDYPVEFELSHYAKDTLYLDIDWNALFHPESSDSIDLSQKIFTHGTESPADRDLCFRFSHNFATGISAHTP